MLHKRFVKEFVYVKQITVHKRAVRKRCYSSAKLEIIKPYSSQFKCITDTNSKLIFDLDFWELDIRVYIRHDDDVSIVYISFSIFEGNILESIQKLDGHLDDRSKLNAEW